MTNTLFFNAPQTYIGRKKNHKNIFQLISKLIQFGKLYNEELDTIQGNSMYVESELKKVCTTSFSKSILLKGHDYILNCIKHTFPKINMTHKRSCLEST